MPTTEYTKYYRIYQSRCYGVVLPILKHISANLLVQLRFPTMRALKAIAKKLLLNAHEALNLAFVLMGNWPYQDVFFAQNSRNLNDIISYRRPEEDYAPIMLYLILQTATIKFSLNDNFRIYSAELERTLPNFKPILQTFMQKYAVKLGHPRELNKIFKGVLDSQELPDYESLIDNTIQLCPIYRTGDEAQDGRNSYDSMIKPGKTGQDFRRTTNRETEDNHKKLEQSSMYSELDPLWLDNKGRELNQFFHQDPDVAFPSSE